MNNGQDPLEKLSDESIIEADKILGSLDATQDEVDEAQKVKQTAAREIVQEALESITKRTALLQNLTNALTQLTEAVQASNRFTEQLNKLEELLDQANKQLEETKGQSGGDGEDTPQGGEGGTRTT